MNKSSVTVVIAGKTYTLRADDPQAMRDMPTDARDRLIGLLEALKAQRDKSRRLAEDALARSVGRGVAAQSAVAQGQRIQPGERLGKGDVDAIMARLIMEEKQQRKPALQRSTIYKIAAAIIVVIVLLSVF